MQKTDTNFVHTYTCIYEPNIDWIPWESFVHIYTGQKRYKFDLLSFLSLFIFKTMREFLLETTYFIWSLSPASIQ